jgi:sporulation protein YlmC with PRC-barrel domain
MAEIKHTSMAPEQTVDVSHTVGKKVLTNKGHEIGTVKKIHIHPDKLTIEGITINRGLLKEEDYIGKDYIKSLNRQGAMLTITPTKDIKGMAVYDSDGNNIGKVKEVNRSKKTNNIVSVIVKRDEGDLEILKSSIKEIGKSVMLNKRIGKKLEDAS